MLNDGIMVTVDMRVDSVQSFEKLTDESGERLWEWYP